MAATATVTNRLHEAIKAIKDVNDSRPHDAKGYEINDIITDALALPLRNCDLDEVAENPEAAWLNDEDNWDEWGSPKLCIEKWLLAPAKKGGEDGVEGKHVQKKG